MRDPFWTYSDLPREHDDKFIRKAPWFDINTFLDPGTIIRLDDTNVLEVFHRVKNAELIFSDLDNTLVQSKYQMTSVMAEVFSELLKTKKIVIVTWGTIETVNKNVVSRILDYCNEDQLKNLTLLPLLWNETWEFNIESWQFKKVEEIEESIISLEQIRDLEDAINNVLDEFWRANVPFEMKDVIEKRWVGTTKFIAMSYFGQSVPQEYASMKDDWDKDRNKRNKIIGLIYNHLDSKYKANWVYWDIFELRTGWSTSIDITIRWLDKGSWLENYFSKNSNIKRKDTTFIGDSFSEGWNDVPALRAWVDCIDIWDEKKALLLLQSVVSEIKKDSSN